MKNMLLSCIAALTLALSGCSVSASNADQALVPDVQMPIELKGEPTVDLSLGRVAIKLMSWTSGFVSFDNEETEALTGDLLDQVRGVKIRVFELAPNQAWQNFALTSTSQYADAGWETAVTVNENHEQVVIMTSLSEDAVNGVAIMVFTANEAVFVTLSGKIDPQHLAKLMQQAQKASVSV